MWELDATLLIPCTDPASIYDFDEEEDDERQLTLDMTPLRVGKSRFSNAIAAAAAASTSPKAKGSLGQSPAKMKGRKLDMKKIEEESTTETTTTTMTTATPAKRGRKRGAGVKRKIAVEETKEPQETLSGEENLAPTPPKKKRGRPEKGKSVVLKTQSEEKEEQSEEKELEQPEVEEKELEQPEVEKEETLKETAEKKKRGRKKKAESKKKTLPTDVGSATSDNEMDAKDDGDDLVSEDSKNKSKDKDSSKEKKKKTKDKKGKSRHRTEDEDEGEKNDVEEDGVTEEEMIQEEIGGKSPRKEKHKEKTPRKEKNKDKSPRREKNRVLVDLQTEENSVKEETGDEKVDGGGSKMKKRESGEKGTSEKRDKKAEKSGKADKKNKKKKDLKEQQKQSAAADNEDADRRLEERTLQADDSRLATSTHDADVTKDYRSKDDGDESGGHRSRKKKHSGVAVADDDNDEQKASMDASSESLSAPQEATASNDGTIENNRDAAADIKNSESPESTAKTTEEMVQRPTSPSGSASDQRLPPSSPTYSSSKLSSSPHGFSSPHPHHQPPTMLSPTGDQPPLKLRLSINKVFQAKLEGTASSTSINSSDGEQSGTEGESVCTVVEICLHLWILLE